MIVPSIDLMRGEAVQLIGGREHALNAGNPRPLAASFGLIGEVAVIDLDAALGRGSNAGTIEELLELAPCRVGGGIRNAETARSWLDRGAHKVILGTAATPEVLGCLPRDRVIAALDAYDGEVVIDGWRTRTGCAVHERIRELAPFAGGFLVTFVENEGRMRGLDLARARELADACGDVRLTVAGGVATAAEIAELDSLGIDVQAGMALYTGRFDLAAALALMLQSDRSDGLWPTLVTDELGAALGLAWSNEHSLRAALQAGEGVYCSRKRGLWRKGATSGSTQQLLRVELDCDRDALRFMVRQHGSGFCHRGTWDCFGAGHGLGALERRLLARCGTLPAGSYTARLARDKELLTAKLCEEAGELAQATTREETVHEAADLLYFLITKLAASGVALAEVARELDRRALRIERRGGDAKRHEERECSGA